MIKKSVLLLITACLLMTGCSDKGHTNNSGANSIDKVLNEKTSTESPSSIAETSSATTVTTNELQTALDKNIDYDLTEMGSDMVYATVSQMMYKPEDYVGKMIKISGKYYSTYYEETQQRYYAVIIADAMGCCSQGIEFIWGDGSHVYPDEYPPDETEVEVIGRFETYTEEGSDNLYCRLADAQFNVIK